MATLWTTTYMQHGIERTAEFATFRDAIHFAAEGVEFGTHHVKQITGPDGEVLEGDTLSEARLRYELGEEDDRRR